MYLYAYEIQVKATGGGQPIFGGSKTTWAHIEVLHHTMPALFTVCKNLRRRSRYAPSKFGYIHRNGQYPYTFLL